MSDGKGCVCAARSQSECGCDADWTPQELVAARAEIARLRPTDAEREAIERARDALAATMPYESRQSAADYQTLRGLLERTQ